MACPSRRSPHTDWFRSQLEQEILPGWYNAAITDNGFFHANLNRKWERTPESIASLVSQSRLIYVFSVGYLVTGKERYKQAVKRGISFLLNHFRDTDRGGFHWQTDNRGTPVDPSKEAYGHAFIILALAFSYRVLQDPSLLTEARGVLDLFQNQFQDPFGGIIRKMSEDWQDLDECRTQNPMMHLFEATLELTESFRVHGPGQSEDSAQCVLSQADALASFLLDIREKNRLDFISEFYDRQWNPVPDKQENPFWSGHQFEWAFLLSLGVERGLNSCYLNTAQQLLDIGMRNSLDENTGAVVNEHGKINWWEHCEAIRTLLHFSMQRGNKKYVPPFEQVLAYVQQHFTDPEYKGWYPTLNPDGSPAADFKGSLYKLDYHQTAMCLEAIRLNKDNISLPAVKLMKIKAV